VGALNRTEISPRQAEARWREKLRRGVIHRDGDAVCWVDRWLDENSERILLEQISDPLKVQESADLKIIRAHRGGLICVDRRYLDYPRESVWNRKRFRLKHWHGYACNRCHAKESDGAVLHAHHIVFRSRSGTNSDRNLVTLCARCHQREHPGLVISQTGGEPVGRDMLDVGDPMEISLAAVNEQASPVALPESFDDGAYAAVRPAFISALQETRQRQGSRRELFALLLQVFGRNVGRYALRFAADEDLDAELRAAASVHLP